MKANYHTHTFRCRHAKGTDREFVENAITGGYDILGFSDHCPWIYEDGFVSGIRMTPKEADGYFQSLTDLKKEYSHDIKIYIGFEAEYIPQLIEAQEKFLSGYPVDYLIMGQHFYGHEKHYPYVAEPSDDENILKSYVDSIIEGMDTGKYRYVAHPDLINFTGDQTVYERHMTRLCQYLKDKDIPIEINLLGYIAKRHYPSERFLRIAEKTGNSAIIGCDAHNPCFIASAEIYAIGVEFAKKYGLKLRETLPGLD